MPLSSLFINTLIWLGAMGLSAVFALAAIAKLRDTQRARESLLGFGVPEPWTQPSLIVLVLVELLLAALLAYPPTQSVGAWGTLGALTVFTLAILGQLLRGRRPTCACFGALTPAAIGWRSVGRNLLLMTLAGALVAPRADAAPTLFDTIPWLTLLAGGWAAVTTAWLLLLTRQNGRLLVRLEQLEQRADGLTPLSPVAVGPLRVGAAVPPLGLSDGRGRLFDLHGFRGRPVQLLFLDAACNHCQPLLARLRNAQLSNASAALVVISESASLRHDLPAAITVLVDPGWSTLTLFGLRGTPAAASIDADGALAQGAVHGTAAVHAALDQIIPQEVHHEFAPV